MDIRPWIFAHRVSLIIHFGHPNIDRHPNTYKYPWHVLGKSTLLPAIVAILISLQAQIQVWPPWNSSMSNHTSVSNGCFPKLLVPLIDGYSLLTNSCPGHILVWCPSMFLDLSISSICFLTSFRRILQWTGLRENLEETIDFPMKYGGFLKFFP